MKFELVVYFIYIYLISYYFITYKKLTFQILWKLFLIIYVGSLCMFPIWKCKISFFYNYGYIIAFFYSIWLVALLYYANMFHNKLRHNPLYLTILSLNPLIYFIMIKIIQYSYKCDMSNFLKGNAIFLYFSVILIMSILIIVRKTNT